MSHSNVKDIKLDIPEDVKCIMRAFYDNDYSIYIVGGCVRDSLLNRKINDYDLCTDAKPEEIIKVCANQGFRYIPTGLKHGTVTIVLNNQNYEITTFRHDGDYSDGRHPDSVSFTTSLKEDLSRRDFTVNAMAYSDKTGLIDYFSGLRDMDNRLIRCVGNPSERFSEDNLRRLRAVRFSCQLDYQIEIETYKQLKTNSEGIKLLSIERIREEFCKILTSNNASKGVRELEKLNMLGAIVPELTTTIGFDQHNRHHDKNIFEHTLSVVDNVQEKLVLRLAALFHDIGKPNCFTIDEKGQGHFFKHEIEGAKISEAVLKRLKFDNKTIKKVCLLVRYHMNRYEKIKTVNIKKLINRVGINNLEELFELQIADIKSSAKEYQNFDYVIRLRDNCREIIARKEPLSIQHLEIKGDDLLQLGLGPGKIVGEALNYLMERVLSEPKLNNREKLIELLKDKSYI